MKIFVADPALKDQRGHHYALTANISRNCSALGHKVICLVNKSLSKQTDEDIYFVRCFSTDTYDGHTKRTPVTPKQTTASKPETITKPAPPEIKEPEKKSLITHIKHSLIGIYRLLPVPLREITTPFIHNLRNAKPVEAVSDSAIVEPEESKPKPPVATPATELLGSLKNHSAGPQDIVLFHTSDAHTYRDIVDLFVKAVPVKNWNALPQFHLSTPYDGTTMPHNKKKPPFTQSVQQLSNLGLVGTKVFLRAEHRLLSEHLTDVLSAPVSALPIPPLNDLPERTPEHSTPNTNVTYLGAARAEKGFTTLPQAIRKTLSSTPRLNINFNIQITPQIMGYTPEILGAVEELKQIDDERLLLIDQPLSQDEYLQLLADADVMLLNYTPNNYKFRGSGIAVEAVLSGTTIIAPKATFPAYIAGDSGVFTDYPGGLDTAIQQIHADLPGYRTKAKKRREWYLAEHSAEKFIQVLDTPTHKVDVDIQTQSHRYADTTQWQPLL